MSSELGGFAARLAYAIKVRREERDVSQNQIAELAGIDGGNLTKYLKGEKLERIAAVTVLRLARALDVRFAWLLTGEEPSGLKAAPNETFRLLSEAPEETIREESRGYPERDGSNDSQSRASKNKRGRSA